MYRKIDDFIEDWLEEMTSTLKIFSALDDSHLSSQDHENVRTLGKLAWHITQTVTEMPATAGLIHEDELENQGIPGSVEEICSTYKRVAEALIETIRDKWEDRDLMEEIDMYGQTWKKTKVLSALVKHQIHHRGQMTIIMRHFGFVVPGTYGPSKEEWRRFGMDEQD